MHGLQRPGLIHLCRAAVRAMLPWDRDPGTESPGVPLWDLVLAVNKYDLLPHGQKNTVEARTCRELARAVWAPALNAYHVPGPATAGACELHVCLTA